MKYFLALACIAIAKAGVIKEEPKEDPCVNFVKIDNILHEKDIIAKDLDRPYMLAVDNSSNILYFSYSIQNEEDSFRTAQIDLDDNHFVDLNIVNGFAQTVDQKTRDVYIGSDDGIYKFNHKNNDVEEYGLRGADIWSIYYKDVLYYTEFPSQFLYTLINDTVVRFKDLEDTKVDHFIIDNDDIMYFTNATGFYSQKKETKDSVIYEDFPNNGLRGITIDGFGDIFLCCRDGIYKVDREESVVKKTADIDDCFGIAFDRDNYMLYADSRNIVRLTPSRKRTC